MRKLIGMAHVISQRLSTHRQPGLGEVSRGNLAAQEIRASYREMPGLVLTVAQACRLFGLDRKHVEDTFDTLVQEKFLRRIHDRFVRTD